jgi:hypothetical protein
VSGKRTKTLRVVAAAPVSRTGLEAPGVDGYGLETF